MPGVEARGEPTYFVNNVERPTRADPDEYGTGTVIFGNQPGGGYFQITFLTVKVAEPLVQGVGENASQPRALESRQLSTSTIDTVTAPNDHWGPPEVPRRSGTALGRDGACIAGSDEDSRTGDVPMHYARDRAGDVPSASEPRDTAAAGDQRSRPVRGRR
jgi:hypothetical protein